MPTKPRKDGKPRGSASLAFGVLISGLKFGPADLPSVFDKLYTRFRYGGLAPDDRLSRIFDEHFDLASLPIGLFDQKASSLPDSKLPISKGELTEFLRRLIHVGGDTALIDAVLATWNVTIDDHAEAVWRLHGEHPELFDDIVSGRLGSAARRLRRRESPQIDPREDVLEIVVRQALLWCAMDVQMVTARARVSFTAPLGRFLSSTMRAIKPQTVLKLMRKAEALLETILSIYRTQEREPFAERHTGLRGTVARTIAHRAVSSLKGATQEQVSSIRDELDRTIPYVRTTLSEPSKSVSEVCAKVRTDREPEHDNSLSSFHALWYSGLSPLAGMAVALIRYAQAEQHIRNLVCNTAHHESGAGSSIPLQPLPPLPREGTELVRFRERALFLADHYRRAILRDSDYRSRSRDARFDSRDPLDRSGLTFVGAAVEFLHRCGQRDGDAHRRSAADEDALTFFALDVVPELRLAL